MKQVLLQQGQPVVADVPPPVVEPGTVLVRVRHSCISAGTELSTLRAAGLPLYKRAMQKPDQVRKVLRLVATQGLSRTLQQVRAKLQAVHPIGYSVAGVVTEVGEPITDLHVGDVVACAGAQCAHHAEVVRVPRNLAVRVPDGVGTNAASTVALGAIALQGVRRAQPTLGETFVVLGLGIVGQLTAQILRANGCRVIGADLDRGRIQLARDLGMAAALDPEQGPDLEQVNRLTDGQGADGVIICAATPSDAVAATAFKMCRRKGRVVLVGDVGLNLNRADFYAKELDFFISTSYGPGRYDANYEEKGADYPLSYVRWTENRNMAEYLRLVQAGQVRVEPLIAQAFPVDEAGAAYGALKNDSPRPLIVLLSYPECEGGAKPQAAASRTVKGRGGPVRLAIVGTGAFAKGVHLPNLQKLHRMYQVRAVMSRTGHNAHGTAREIGAAYATTDFDHVLHDAEVDAVLITTRHHLHATYVLKALRAGKHVLVEKPLCLTAAELAAIESFYGRDAGAKPVLLTGFNRRFSPYLRRIHELTRQRLNPMVLNYRMNAGYLPPDHWVFSPEGGGRNLGEACHVYDLLTYLTDSPVKGVQAQAVRPPSAFYGGGDNFVATLTFADGSVATVTYTAMGARDYPKELFEVYADGKVLAVEDYGKLTVAGARAKGLATRTPEKGHLEELEAFAKAVRDGGPWPSPLWQQVQATRISFEVEQFLTPAAEGQRRVA